jgi:hypothetical protein
MSPQFECCLSVAAAVADSILVAVAVLADFVKSAQLQLLQVKSSTLSLVLADWVTHHKVLLASAQTVKSHQLVFRLARSSRLVAAAVAGRTAAAIAQPMACLVHRVAAAELV